MEMINIKELPTLLPSNVNWSRFFQNDYPLDLEIGCGRPHFFFDRANNFARRNIVGVEWKYEFVWQGQKRIAREGIKNAALLHGNAWFIVPLLFAPNSISQVFVNFPDPWWKKRHKKRLVLNEVFLHALRERMLPEGFILLQTDVYELFSYYQELLNQSGLFFFDKSVDQVKAQRIANAKTHREKKCIEQGLNIHRGLFRSKRSL